MKTLDSLIAGAGTWQGVNRLYLSPPEPPDESSTTLVVTPLLQGRFLRLDQTWAMEGQPQEGSLLVGYDGNTGTATLHWIDTFHMGCQVLECRGDLHDDGTLDVRGSYAAPPGPDWGWRVTIRVEAGQQVQVVMFNIEPEGTEELAVEATFTRAG